MMSLAIPVLREVLTAFNRSKQGRGANISGEMLDRLEEFLLKDKKAQQQLMDFINQSREHDQALFQYNSPWANNVRGIVRPVATLLAMGWYVYARVNQLELSSEDYAVIGGILAFWFGLRPFEKKR